MKTSKQLLLAAVIAASAPLTISAADVAENWEKNCVSCHGKDGKGQTKAGKKAGTKDMTDVKYQADLTDEKAIASIKDGVKENGKEKMKPFAGKLNDEEIKALVFKVRAFKQ